MQVNKRNLFLGAISYATSNILPISFAQCLESAKNYGQFIGNPEGRLVHGIFELSKDFDYIDPEGRTWRVSAPFPTDGASIPSLFWPLIGHPLGGEYVSAAVVHDYFCNRKHPSSELVHRNFYLGMRANGVSEELAWIMYKAVLWFGPTWTDSIISRECEAGSDLFEPRRCMYNYAGPSGKAAPSFLINKENLESFLSEISAKGYESRAKQLRQIPKVKEILAS